MSSQEFVNTLKRLIAREVRTLLPRWRWGKVISLSPIVVELDAEQGTLPDVKTNVAPVIVNDRVQVMTWRERSRIVAVSGGAGSGTRSFPTLAAAQAAGLPVGSQVWVSSEDQGYVLLQAGFFPLAPVITGDVPLGNTPIMGEITVEVSLSSFGLTQPPRFITCRALNGRLILVVRDTTAQGFTVTAYNWTPSTAGSTRVYWQATL